MYEAPRLPHSIWADFKSAERRDTKKHTSMSISANKISSLIDKVFRRIHLILDVVAKRVRVQAIVCQKVYGPNIFPWAASWTLLDG